jgi:hypothetical protein
MKQPIQPLELDDKGTLRFKKNAIVEYLLDASGIDMNKLARLEFSNEDRMQFAMLIGYSLGGASELSYFDDETLIAAQAIADHGLSEVEARNQAMGNLLGTLREGLRGPIAELYGMHPDDLGES